jgi:hypothetical protein
LAAEPVGATSVASRRLLVRVVLVVFDQVVVFVGDVVV